MKKFWFPMSLSLSYLRVDDDPYVADCLVISSSGSQCITTTAQ